jgi:UDP-glucose 4-epimerase
VLDALDAAIEAPDDASGVYFVADRDAVSTPRLVRAIAAALGVAPRLVHVPVGMLRLAATLAGEREAIGRLTDSLEVDPSALTAAPGWSPRPFAIDASMVAR